MACEVEPTVGSIQSQIIQDNFFQESFYLSNLPMVVADFEGVCLLANQNFKHHFGVDGHGGEVKIPSLDKIVENPQMLNELLSRIRDRNVVRNQEILLKDREGILMAMHVSGRYVLYESQPAVELILISAAHRNRLGKRLRRDQARLSSLMESLSTGLFLVNQRDQVEVFNREMANILEFNSPGIIGKSYKEIFSHLLSIVKEPEVLQERLEQSLVAINEKPTFEFELTGEKTKIVGISFFPVWGDKGVPLGWGGMVQDITEERERLNWKLEMLSVLSHDIRSPLATLKGQTTALMANFHHWGDEMNMDFLDGINRSTDKLIHQVERSLALTRVEAGRLGLRPEACEMENILSLAVERISGPFNHTHIVMDLEQDLPDVQADPARVEEVVINLLENALRYSPSDQEIVIGARVAEPMLEISVMDHGPGVPTEKQELIFEKYSRADHKSEGSGLGLYISRKIVEAHGGRIRVESPLKGMEIGARFTFTLPIVPAKAKEKLVTQKVREVVEEDEEEGLRVLVVEDEADFQELLRTILKKEGYQVEMAPDGPTAIDIVHTSAPDIILLDWMMPGMSGLSTCRNIRRWTDAPILMVTSRTAQEDLIAALDAGADDYVTKPFRTPEFLARIQALARRRKEWVHEEPDRFSTDGLSINFDTYEVWRSGTRVELTPTEFDLLAYLIHNRNQVLTYDQLMDHLYGTEKDRNRHDLFVHISRLRKKIELDPNEPCHILTKWGVGYSFEAR